MLTINGNILSLQDVDNVAHNKIKVALAPEIAIKLSAQRKKLDALIAEGKPMYGINTGFGALAETTIAFDDLLTLQKNLILSHAVGVGPLLPFSYARALMLLRANALAKGFSGCRSIIVETMLTLLNAGVAPAIPCKGSVGASGDLAPLAHLALLLLGEGEALVNNRLVPAKDALKHAGVEAITLLAKEGLSLINGTQAMSALGCLEAQKIHNLCNAADIIGSCSLLALKGNPTAFDERIHKARAHEGQKISATLISSLTRHSRAGGDPGEQSDHQNLLDSRLRGNDSNIRLQDPYSLRCMPQVHGATRDCLQHVSKVLETEINSATDNPLIFERDDGSLDILSGGNFHGQPIALALDYLGIAAAELANISERRIEHMVNPSLSKLPAFLAKNPGINSGFMILQVTAAALINENKVLCYPASADSIPTSANREDHVSMGMTSANKLRQIAENTSIVLAIELMCACQAVDLGGTTLTSPLEKLYKSFRKSVPFAEHDRAFKYDLDRAVDYVHSINWADIIST